MFYLLGGEPLVHTAAAALPRLLRQFVLLSHTQALTHALSASAAFNPPPLLSADPSLLSSSVVCYTSLSEIRLSPLCLSGSCVSSIDFFFFFKAAELLQRANGS